jgi:pimeloyl-ACP methyl ester carboxylesterase
MATFALIHGGFHGGWCWDLLVPELQKRGHRAVAPDMPISDPTCGNVDYAAIVIDALDDVDDDVVVVGHSQGGTTVPYVAAVREVAKMIYLASAVPLPGESFAEFLVANPTFLNLEIGESDDRGCMVIAPEVARSTFFDDCPEDVAAWAIARLRNQAPTPIAEVCSLTEFPKVPAEYIVCLDDSALNPEACRELAHDRLGVVAREIPGSHSPFLTRPSELADLLAALI